MWKLSAMHYNQGSELVSNTGMQKTVYGLGKLCL